MNADQRMVTRARLQPELADLRIQDPSPRPLRAKRVDMNEFAKALPGTMLEQRQANAA